MIHILITKTNKRQKSPGSCPLSVAHISHFRDHYGHICTLDFINLHYMKENKTVTFKLKYIDYFVLTGNRGGFVLGLLYTFLYKKRQISTD